MNEREEKKKGGSRRVLAIILFVVAGVLMAGALIGYVLRGTSSTKGNLDEMRSSAVLHAASEGLIENIAQDARAAKLKELRSDKNFRKRGLDEVNGICDAAMEEARQEAEKKYTNPVVQDEEAFRKAIEEYEAVLSVSGALGAKEKEDYAELYVALADGVSDWTDLVSGAADDDALIAALGKVEPDLLADKNSHLQASFASMARDMAQKEQEKEDAELLAQMISVMRSEIADWTEYSDLDDEKLWSALSQDIPELAGQDDNKEAIVEAAKENIAAAVNGETLAAEEAADEGAETFGGTQADYAYFVPTEELAREEEENDRVFQGLMEQLTTIIPDLSGLDSKLQETLEGNIDAVIWPGSLNFISRYEAYMKHGAQRVLEGSEVWFMRIAANAQKLLLAAIALLLMGLVMFFWTPLTQRLGVPRTIITLFFILLCLLAQTYRISVPMMLGNVLERMSMYGILVLAMMPGIQCGIGLNMGMTIGCIAGLLGIVLSLQFNMTGFAAMIFACASGAAISIPLGWGYSKLLNRMKGSEMTISTYVGFSFVSLMCIGWMMLPFNNPKIIWLLSGHGLRVTHSLLGSFAHMLDNLLSFEVLGIHVPTGGLLFLGVCAFLMWLFSRSRTGIAMTAAGSNPRFAEASGINVNQMRTIGTVLSTVIAAVGIVIYSQAFGYAQLYTAPRQLGFIAASAILIGGATVSKAKVSHVIIGVFLFEGVLVFGQQIANAAVAGGGLSEVMRIMISNGIILYALTQSGGAERG